MNGKMSYRERLVKIDGEYKWVEADVVHLPIHSAAFHKQAITESRPWKSRAMAVHSSQVDKFNADVKRAGLTGVRYTETGDLQVTSRSQRRMEMKRRGMLDRDAGYGDAS